MNPSILDEGRCVLPAGSGCLSVAVDGLGLPKNNPDSNCMTGTTCKFIDDKSDCTENFRNLLIKIAFKALFASLNGIFQNVSLAAEAPDPLSTIETELCTCAPIV